MGGSEVVEKVPNIISHLYLLTTFHMTGLLMWFSIDSITTLPIIAKGILRGDDAVKAVQAGCSAILVSNHGARQLDGVPATVNKILDIDIELRNHERALCDFYVTRIKLKLQLLVL